jgi:hypothetical protein
MLLGGGHSGGRRHHGRHLLVVALVVGVVEAATGRRRSSRRDAAVVLSVLRSKLHALLLLPLVAEPHAHHVLLQVQLLGDRRNFLPGRPRLRTELSNIYPKINFHGTFQDRFIFIFFIFALFFFYFSEDIILFPQPNC